MQRSIAFSVAQLHAVMPDHAARPVLLAHRQRSCSVLLLRDKTCPAHTQQIYCYHYYYHHYYYHYYYVL